MLICLKTWTVFHVFQTLLLIWILTMAPNAGLPVGDWPHGMAIFQLNCNQLVLIWCQDHTAFNIGTIWLYATLRIRSSGEDRELENDRILKVIFWIKISISTEMRFALVFLIMMTRHWIQTIVQSLHRAKMLAKVIPVAHSFVTLMVLQLWLESFPGALNVTKKVIRVFTAIFNICATGSNKISIEINYFDFWWPRLILF